MSDVETRLRELIALSDAATEGPWEAQGSHVEGLRLVVAVATTLSHAPVDAALIAAYRNEAPAAFRALLAVLAELDLTAGGEDWTRISDIRRAIGREMSGKETSE